MKTQDLAAVHRSVTMLKRRLATLGNEQRGRRKGRVVDVRRTMRTSLETGGVPLTLRYRPKRPRRPEIYVLCDVSTSVTSASVFFLSVLHALHDSFRKLRSFVFIERTTASWSAMLAHFGISSLKCTPGIFVGMLLNGPP